MNISKNYLSKLTKDEIYDRVLNYSKEFDTEFYDLLVKYEDYSKSIFNIEREQKKPRKDYATYADAKKQIWYMYDELFDKYFEKYYLGYFNFTKRNKVLPHHLVFYNNIITDFKYIKKDNLLYIQIKPRMEENMVIHLNIFGYRKTGEFIDPYIPITLRMINNNIIKSLFYAPTFNSLYDYEKEKEFYYGYIDEIVKIKNGLVETTLIIDLNKFPHYLDINRNIGFNMYLYKLKNNSIFKCFCIQPYYRKPLLIK